MPMYRVISGDFNTTIRRPSHEQAATDAIGTLRSGNFDSILLGWMTVVTLDGGDEQDALFVKTMTLVQQHGLKYRECQKESA